MALLAPGGSLTESNLEIKGYLLIVTSGANTRNKVIIRVGGLSEKTVAVS